MSTASGTLKGGKKLTDKKKEARRVYYRKWRNENRDKVREYSKAWRKSHRENVKEYNKKFWEKRAAQDGEEIE